MFTWDFPYASQRMPLLAKNVVATSQPLAAQAGLQALAKGGNAVDAALAAAITLTVVEPTSNGIGSDAFAILWDGEKLVGLNASGRSPAGWTPERFKGRTAMPVHGWDAVTVPGCVSAWVALSQRYGKLPFADLFQAAIRYARDGFMVSPITAVELGPAGAELQGLLRVRAGRSCRRTARRAPASASTARSRPRRSRRSPRPRARASTAASSAERIALASQADEGAHTLADFAAHRCDWVEPLSVEYRGYRLHEIPPNGQGIVALMALGILRHFDLAALPVDGADSLHLQIEAMKLAFADAYRYVSDPATMEFDARKLLDDDYLARARQGDRHEARAGPAAGRAPRRRHDLPHHGGRERDDGVLHPVELHGLRLGRRGARHRHLACRTAARASPSSPGIPTSSGRGKRPFQTIIPGFLTKRRRARDELRRDGRADAAAGPRADGHAHRRLPARTRRRRATAPRWIVNNDFSVSFEHERFAPGVLEELARRGHRVVDPPRPRCSASAARSSSGAWTTATAPESDHRKDGCAVGF